MTPPSDHERCSELLRPYVADELARPDAEWVAEHLSGCEECSAEEAALRWIVADVQPLTDLESLRLRKEVHAALAEDAGASVIPERTSNWRERLLPALSAAAVVILLVFAATQVDLSGSDNDAESGVATALDGSSGEEQPGAEDSDDLVENAPQSDSVAPEAQGAGAGADGDGYTNTSTDGPQPIFGGEVGKVSPSELERQARHLEPYTSFSESYRGRDADSLQDRFVRRLADRAKTPGAAEDLRSCASNIFRVGEDYNYLPVYAALGRVRGSQALVLGFAYSEEKREPLNKFQVWAWKRPGCDQVLLYQSGRIRRP